MSKHANGWERKRPAGWKPPFSYSAHNLPFIERLLVLYHANARPRAGVVPWDLNKAIKSAAKRYNKFIGATSKYVPHQGEREKERRRLGGFARSPERANLDAFSLR